jgi:hypothetical protein
VKVRTTGAVLSASVSRGGSMIGRVGARSCRPGDCRGPGEQDVDNAIYKALHHARTACPPEDCGGIGGFYDLLDALKDPNHDEHEELQDWVGDDYDPEAFSIEAVNRMLTRLLPRRSMRSSRSALAR